LSTVKGNPMTTPEPLFETAPDMQAYYAVRATEYDLIYRKPERQADLRQMERWVAGIFAGRRVLEVACGTGYWTQFFAPASQSVLAIDAAAETLRIARGRVPLDKVELRVGDAYALPVAPASCDAAFAGFWWSHVPRARIAAFVHGLHAALQPGAKVVLIDNRFVPGSSTPIAERDAEGNTYQARPLANGSVHRILKNFPTREELSASVAGVAQDLRYHAWEHYWALEYTTRVPAAGETA
jgi:ubiquinone/menaquinone biosynthesis C-methylase UbiE